MTTSPLPPDPNRYGDEAHLALWQINLLGLVTALIFAAGGALITATTVTQIQPLDYLGAFGLAGISLLGPAMITTLHSQANPVAGEAAYTLLLLLLLSGLGWLNKHLALGDLTTTVGVPLTTVLLLVFVRRATRQGLELKSTLGILLLAGLIGAWLLAVAWGGGRYQSPFFYERLLTDKAWMDTLYHAAMANMLSIHGVPSTGLDGLPWMHYHWGTHWLFGQLAGLQNMSLLTFYNSSVQVVFLPLLLKAMLLLVLALRRARRLTPRLGPAALLVLFVMLSGFLPDEWLRRFAVWNAHLIRSESYQLGLSAAMLGAVVAVSTLNSRSKPRMVAATALLLLPLLLAVIGMFKVSVMVLCAGAYGYWVLRTGRLLRPLYFASLSLVAVASLSVLPLTGATGYAGGIQWFDFYLTYVRPGDAPRALYFLLHYAWLWLLLALWVHHYQTRGERFARALFGGQQLEFEILIAVAIAGALPGMLLHIPAGGAFYFSDVHRVLAGVLLLATWPRLLSAGKHAATRGASAIVLGMGAVAMVGTSLALGVQRIDLTARALRAERYRILHRLESGKDGAVHALLDRLHRLASLPLQEKVGACLYIDKSLRSYWDILSRPGAAPFVAPAITGLPLVFGLPDDTQRRDFRYNEYDGFERVSGPVPEPRLLETARQRGCRTLHSLRGDGEAMNYRRRQLTD